MRKLGLLLVLAVGCSAGGSGTGVLATDDAAMDVDGGTELDGDGSGGGAHVGGGGKTPGQGGKGNEVDDAGVPASDAAVLDDAGSIGAGADDASTGVIESVIVGTWSVYSVYENATGGSGCNSVSTADLEEIWKIALDGPGRLRATTDGVFPLLTGTVGAPAADGQFGFQLENINVEKGLQAFGTGYDTSASRNSFNGSSTFTVYDGVGVPKCRVRRNFVGHRVAGP